MGFRDYVVWRRGTVPVAALAAAAPHRTWELVDDIERAENTVAQQRDAVLDDLFAVVPALPTADRRIVLGLRRDVHNDRAATADAMGTARAALSPAATERLADWAAAVAERDRLAADAERAIAEESASFRSMLASLVDGDFAKGIQLSGAELYRRVVAYRRATAGTGARPADKRLRTAEHALVNYAYRAAFKPSPFGSFVEIGSHSWHPGPAGQDRQVRRVRLNRGFLEWLAGDLHRLDGSDRVVRLWCNDTLTVEDGKARFFHRGQDATAGYLTGERLVSVPLAAPVQLVIQVLGDGRRTRNETVALLCERTGARREAVDRLLDRLIATGLILRGPAVPDQCERYPAAVAASLRTIPDDDQAAECAGVFEELQAVEDGFGGADVDERAALLDRLGAATRRFVRCVGMTPIDNRATIARTMIFEDVGRTGRSTTWQPDLLRDNEVHFTLLRRILPLFDDTTLATLGLYAHFTSNHTTANLLDYYQEFASLPPGEAQRILAARGDRHADELLAYRRKLVEHIADLVHQPGGPDTVRLDPAWLSSFADDLPDHLPTWRSLAHRVQFARADRLVVVNSCVTGHGVYFSRFCDLVEPEPDGWSLGAAVRAAAGSRQADLVAGLGLNITAHPRLTPLEVVYPGCVPLPSDTPPLSVRDLEIRPDPTARRLQLVSRVDGQPLHLVPMSFLTASLGPSLYRFLSAFTQGCTSRGGWWQHTGLTGGRLPRLVLGDLVLDRRTWFVGPEDRIRIDDVGSVAAMRRLRTWHARTGLPVQGFFRFDQPAGAGPTAHKPRFVDFRNPLLVHPLLTEAGDATLRIQECLPALDDYADAPAGAEEFVIETHDGS